MTSDFSAQPEINDDLLQTLQSLLSIEALELRPALTRPPTWWPRRSGPTRSTCSCTSQDKDSLVALGTSRTPMGRASSTSWGWTASRWPTAARCAAVLHRRRAVLTGTPSWTRPSPAGWSRGSGSAARWTWRSRWPERRGVVGLPAPRRSGVHRAGPAFLEAVGRWVGLVTHRGSELSGLGLPGRRVARGGGRGAGKLTRRQQEVAACIRGAEQRRDRRAAGAGGGHGGQPPRGHPEQARLPNRTQLGVWAVERGLSRTDQTQDD